MLSTLTTKARVYPGFCVQWFEAVFIVRPGTNPWSAV